jgi:hypothetical protein
MVQSRPRQKCEFLSEKGLREKKDGSMTQMVDLPSKVKVLSSNPSTTPQKEKIFNMYLLDLDVVKMIFATFPPTKKFISHMMEEKNSLEICTSYPS